MMPSSQLAINHLSEKLQKILSNCDGKTLNLDYQLTNLPPHQSEAVLEYISLTFPKLQYLQLVGNNLKSVPESLSGLTLLRILRLDWNQLVSLPESLGKLTQLVYLNLSHNQLTTLPKSLGNLPQLEGLALDNNKLTALPISMIPLFDKIKQLLFEKNLLTFPPQNLVERVENPYTSYKAIKDFFNHAFKQYAFGLDEIKEARSLLSLTRVSKHFYQAIKGYAFNIVTNSETNPTETNIESNSTPSSSNQDLPPPIMLLPNELLEKILLTASKIPAANQHPFIHALRKIDTIIPLQQEERPFAKAMKFLDHTAPTWEERIRQCYQESEQAQNR